MTRTEWEADRRAVLAEIAAIEFDLAILEQQYGAYADFDDVRQRVQRVRVGVLEQVRTMRAAGTVH